VFSYARFPGTTLVIDPGHGGEDGGAVSVAGQAESAVNLAIGLRLDALFHFCGVRTEMTRRTDVSLHDGDCTTLRAKKVSDLHKRAAFVNGIPDATLISLHQNSFPQQKYHGTQVFFGKAEPSRQMAENIQSRARQILDPGNTRAALPVAGSVYLMKQVTCPAILIECGFLSNPGEANLLKNEHYQTKVAYTIAAACLQYAVA
jgi:N-acetylmuramoyl-L-alanine amidase